MIYTRNKLCPILKPYLPTFVNWTLREISHAPIRKPCLSCELTQNNLIPYPFHRGNGSLPHLISDEGEVVWMFLSQMKPRSILTKHYVIIRGYSTLHVSCPPRSDAVFTITDPLFKCSRPRRVPWITPPCRNWCFISLLFLFRIDTLIDGEDTRANEDRSHWHFYVFFFVSKDS